MSPTLHYLYDPLCGWCYGAGPAVSALAASPEITLNLLASGLFAGEGARPLDEGFAAYAWTNDQRIERLTGQQFSERYRREVLGDRTRPFDSGPATLALAAVHLEAPQQEAAALAAIQQARYVDGRDNTEAGVLADILNSLGLSAAAARLSSPDAALLAAVRARSAMAQTLMRQFGARGVPTFILEVDGRQALVDASAAFADPQAFARQLTTTTLDSPRGGQPVPR